MSSVKTQTRHGENIRRSALDRAWLCRSEFIGPEAARGTVDGRECTTLERCTYPTSAEARQARDDWHAAGGPAHGFEAVAQDTD